MLFVLLSMILKMGHGALDQPRMWGGIDLYSDLQPHFTFLPIKTRRTNLPIYIHSSIVIENKCHAPMRFQIVDIGTSIHDMNQYKDSNDIKICMKNRQAIHNIDQYSRRKFNIQPPDFNVQSYLKPTTFYLISQQNSEEDKCKWTIERPVSFVMY